MALTSPLASIIGNSLRQTCTVYRYGGSDPSGQPVYHDGVEYPCRLAIRTVRQMSPTGDIISNTAVETVVPADCPVQAHDMIDLPAPYEQGAVIREVVTATDQWARTTHKVVRIL